MNPILCQTQLVIVGATGMVDGNALAVFCLSGLPGIAPLVRAPGYSEQAHSAEDTLDKVSPVDLRQAMLVLAMASLFPCGCT